MLGHVGLRRLMCLRGSGRQTRITLDQPIVRLLKVRDRMVVLGEQHAASNASASFLNRRVKSLAILGIAAKPRRCPGWAATTPVPAAAAGSSKSAAAGSSPGRSARLTPSGHPIARLRGLAPVLRIGSGSGLGWSEAASSTQSWRGVMSTDRVLPAGPWRGRLARRP